MDIQKLMDELLEHGCILQSREELAKSIIASHVIAASYPEIMSKAVIDVCDPVIDTEVKEQVEEENASI